jgi:hypothetical protein
VVYLLRHVTSVFKVISERPVNAVLLAKKQSIPFSYGLGLTRPARVEFELTTSRLPSESTRSTTRLLQPVYGSMKVSNHEQDHCYHHRTCEMLTSNETVDNEDKALIYEL